MSAAPPPVPVPDERSAPFWEAAADGRLSVQRCSHCGWLLYPPKGLCPACSNLSPDFDWVDVSGLGRLSTWTVVHDPFLPGFVDDAPYVVGDVELDEQEGLRVLARVVGIAAADLHLGRRLSVAFEPIGEGFARPYFLPAEQAT